MSRIIHVPMALSTQGSTLMAVAQSLIDAGAPQGIDSAAILSHNRGVSLANARVSYVDYTANCPREWFDRRELAVDVAAGVLGRTRPHYGRLYDPAVKAAAESGADVILLYEGHYASASIPRWQKVRARSKLVLYVHNPLSRTYGRRELRRLISGVDAVAFCADHLRDDVAARLGAAPPAPLMTVHNGVGAEFAPGPVAAGATGPMRVVFAGRPVENKGVHLVLEGVAIAEKLIDRPFAVEIIGSDSYGYRAQEMTTYERRLRESAERMESPVEFLPFLSKPELAAHLRSATVVCLPSQWAEGLPLVALEAMACGAAVVTSDSAGMLEAVGSAGLIAPRGDPEAIAGHLVSLARSPQSLAAAQEASVIQARAFSWDRAVSALAALS